jgi:hypothetical protein
MLAHHHCGITAPLKSARQKVCPEEHRNEAIHPGCSLVPFALSFATRCRSMPICRAPVIVLATVVWRRPAGSLRGS